jgi:peptidoglycan/LPS O-acetylase OafA/YrhL
MMRAAATHQSSVPQQAARRYELDWLRTLVVLGLVPIHTANIFSAAPDIFFKNRETSDGFVVLGTFVGVFGMPLLFFVSGAATRLALGHRTPGRYARERVTRLLVPLVFATLVIIPIQAYLVLLADPHLATVVPIRASDPHYLDSYLRFYPQYLVSYVAFLMHPSFVGTVIFLGHLWFIVCLFVFSLGSLPLLLWLRSAGGQRPIARLARFCERPGAILLLGVPLSLGEAVFRAALPALASLAEIFVYLLFFLCGYVVYADARFTKAIQRHGLAAFILAGVLWVVAEVVMIKGQARPYDNSMGTLVFLPLRDIIAWFWVVAILSFGMRFLASTSRVQRALAEAAYPVYVLHIAVIAGVGMFVVRWGGGILPKYLVIVAATFAITLALYGLLIKRTRVTRLLFGVRPIPAPTPVVEGSPPAERERVLA